MKLGVALPLSDIGREPTTVRLFVQAAEAAGYAHLGAQARRAHPPPPPQRGQAALAEPVARRYTPSALKENHDG